MTNFDINVFVHARANSCKIGRAPYAVRLISYNADRAPYDTVRTVHGRASADVIINNTDAGRRPYDM